MIKKKIKWKIFTTDFEISLYTAFKNVFTEIENLKHKGCFFYYLKNIWKFLIKNWFNKKVNKKKYKYIIENCYELPLKKNIHQTINKELQKKFKNNKDYEEFLTYFKNQ